MICALMNGLWHHAIGIGVVRGSEIRTGRMECTGTLAPVDGTATTPPPGARTCQACMPHVIDHDYLSAGENPHASGDRAYRGCTVPMGDGQPCGAASLLHRAPPPDPRRCGCPGHLHLPSCRWWSAQQRAARMR